jgi:hypothetical protein
MTIKRLVAFAVCALTVSPAVASNFAVFTDRNAFLAATTGAVTDSFETAPPNSQTDYGNGYGGNGFTISSSAHYLYNFDSGTEPSFDWGSGDIMLFHNASTLTFTIAPGRTAFGMDLMTIENGSSDFGGAFVINGLVFGGGITTKNHPERSFIGFAYDGFEITTFTLRVGNANYGLFDNFTLADAGAVPEPATWAFMIIGFGAIGASLRSARRRETSLVAA